jgi:hypothetical protein
VFQWHARYKEHSTEQGMYDAYFLEFVFFLCSQLRKIFSHIGHLRMYDDMFGCHMIEKSYLSTFNEQHIGVI